MINQSITSYKYTIVCVAVVAVDQSCIGFTEKHAEEESFCDGRKHIVSVVMSVIVS